MSALKKVAIVNGLRMRPDCHPEHFFDVQYLPERGGDLIHVRCSQCYRLFFRVKLPKERGDAD